MQSNLKQVEKLKRKGESLDRGIDIVQLGEVRHITIHMGKAKFKGVAWTSLNDFQKQEFENLLYLSNVGFGNPKFFYTV